jgi:uncharacterized membrane protein YdfJ with MMPL/SSD domain
VAAALLLNVLIVRPVLLPAVAAGLGRLGWWPTLGNRPGAPTANGGGRIGSPEALARAIG